MASSTSTTTPIKHAFQQRVDGVRCPKGEINTLILDYLTLEGYPDAAAKFAKEANLQPLQPNPAVRSRQQIKHSIQSGNIQDAIDALNGLDPQILEDESTLHFALLRLQLVELIRTCTESPSGDITPALTFATQHLAPRAPTDPQFLSDLEQTMALLIFPHDKLEAPLAALLKPNLRRDVADKVNRTITDRHYRRREAALRDLARMREWSEKAARGGKDLPLKLELKIYGKADEDVDETHENGHDPMVMT